MDKNDVYGGGSIIYVNVERAVPSDVFQNRCS